MKTKKLIIRLIVSPFILGLLIIAYTVGCLKRWIGFIKFGGEWINYEKGDPKTIQDIFKILKEQSAKENTKIKGKGQK